MKKTIEEKLRDELLRITKFNYLLIHNKVQQREARMTEKIWDKFEEYEKEKKEKENEANGLGN